MHDRINNFKYTLQVDKLSTFTIYASTSDFKRILFSTIIYLKIFFPNVLRLSSYCHLR